MTSPPCLNHRHFLRAQLTSPGQRSSRQTQCGSYMGGHKISKQCVRGCSYRHFSKQSCAFHMDWEALLCSPASAVLFHAPFPPLWFWRWIHSRWMKNFSHVQDAHTPACTAASAPVPSASLQWAVGMQAVMSLQPLHNQPSLATASSVLHLCTLTQALSEPHCGQTVPQHRPF